MSFAQASLLFLVQFAFGSLITFVLADRAALGPKYFKFGGWVLVACYGLALSVAWNQPGRPLVPAIACAALLAAGAAVVLGALGTDVPALAIGSALGSSLVLGFTTWGMILGHWYLVSQGLSVGHLARLVRPLPWILLGKAAISALALLLLWEQVLGPGNRSLGDVMERSPDRVLDVVNVWARIPVGLLAPVVMAFMTRVTVAMERTRPATGILYAMCVLVYMGELMGKMLEGGTGVPA